MAVATSKEPFELRTAAIRAAATFNESEVTNELLAAKRWAALAPAEREVTLSALLTQASHVPRVLDAIEAGALPKNVLSAAQRTALSKSKDAAVRDRVTKLLGAAADGDRMKAYEAEKVVLTLTPNPKHGGEIFKNLCSTCHRLNQEGHQVGPDLLDIRSQPKESILMHIVVPDFEIAPGFAASNIDLKDGSVRMGIVISDTPESVTIREPLGVEENILRSNITALAASEHSLMPPGLEAAMSKQDMADLLSFLKGEN
jgi:putative heme-binding domain-containing protein